MTKIYLIRHGRAAASYTDNLDPGLDDLGRTQAEEAADILTGHTPLKILSSPLKRAMETAMPLSTRTGTGIETEYRVSEVPSPGLSLKERGPWLSAVMQGDWQDQSDELLAWQKEMVDCLTSLVDDTAIFTHFVAINAIVAAVEQTTPVLAFRPDNGSITTLQSDGLALTLLSLGREGKTKVN